MTLVHVALPDEWIEASDAGHYPWSSRSVTFADEGFVHLSRPHQVAGVLNRFYADVEMVLLLVIEDASLPDVVDEDLYGAGENFPHLYRALPVEAISFVVEVERSDDGSWWVPPVIT
jgi:glutathione S-transferase